jgi:hypothetical protein
MKDWYSTDSVYYLKRMHPVVLIQLFHYIRPNTTIYMNMKDIVKHLVYYPYKWIPEGFRRFGSHLQNNRVYDLNY